jgi:hypothetical protein
VERLDPRVAPSVTTLGVFDPASGTWNLRNSNTPGAPNAGQFAFGSPNSVSIPVVGDWDGDGTTTIGVAEKSGGALVWKLRNSNSPGAPDITFAYGKDTDIPVVGDWNGAGVTTIGIYEPDTGTWKLRNSNSAGAPDITVTYGGLPGTVPVAGDWDGDGTTTIGVVEPAGNLLMWKLRNSNTPGAPDIAPFPYGVVGWTPVAGDWDGDGKWTAGAFDPIGQFGQPPASWYLTNSNSNGAASGPAATPVAYGTPGWTPAPGHWTAKPTVDAIADQVINENAGAQTVNLSGISAGGADQTLTVSATSSNPALVPDPTVTYSSPDATGTLAYAPAANQSGTATITVTLRNAGADTFSRTFTVSVTAVNQAPAGANNTVTTPQDTPFDFPTAVFGFTDPNDTPPNHFLAVKITTLPGAGTLTDGGSAVSAGQFVNVADITAGKLVFTPATHASGTPYTSFTFQVQDDGGTANGGVDLDPTPRTMTINVSAVNQPPVAVADSIATDSSTAASGNVLTNDSDPDGDTLTVSAVNGQAANVGTQITLTSGALLTLHTDGSYSYDPHGAFNSLARGGTATDSFNYTANDGHGGTATATATVTITGVNHPPVAVADTNATDQNTPVSGNVLTNDSDPDGDALTVSAVNGQAANVGTQITLTSGALLTLNANGSYSYDPHGSFNSLVGGQTSTDSFNYTASDGHGGTATATVTITITGVNHAPTLTAGATFDLGSTNVTTPSTATAVSAILAGTGYADVDTGAVSGIAVTATNGTGTWEYSLNGGTTWISFGAVSDTVSLLLSSSALVRYVPDGTNAETVMFTFRAWDRTSGTEGSQVNTTSNGGSTAFSSATASASLNVTIT